MFKHSTAKLDSPVSNCLPTPPQKKEERETEGREEGRIMAES